MKNFKAALLAGGAFALTSAATVAHADIITLTFEGVGNLASVDEFYNGGTDSDGNSGTNFGISFSDTSLAIVDEDAGGDGNFGNEPSPDTILFFLSGGAATMNVAAGFEDGFSFFYTSVSFAGSVTVYDGLDGTGNILGSLSLDALGVGPGDPTGDFSNWEAIGVTFDGVARSVDFAGVADQIGFDNVTFGTEIPGTGNPPVPTPEPASFALLGLGLVGLGLARRRSAIA